MFYLEFENGIKVIVELGIILFGIFENSPSTSDVVGVYIIICERTSITSITLYGNQFQDMDHKQAFNRNDLYILDQESTKENRATLTDKKQTTQQN